MNILFVQKPPILSFGALIKYQSSDRSQNKYDPFVSAVVSRDEKSARLWVWMMRRSLVFESPAQRPEQHTHTDTGSWTTRTSCPLPSFRHFDYRLHQTKDSLMRTSSSIRSPSFCLPPADRPHTVTRLTAHSHVLFVWIRGLQMVLIA